MANEEFKILRLLIENQEEEYSIRRISLLRKINYKSAYNALKKLQKQGIVDQKKIGNTTICSFNHTFNEKVFAVEYSRRNEMLKNKNLHLIYNELSNLPQQFIVLLFGSFAKGTQTKHSDIDLLFIGEKNKEIIKSLGIFPLKIHITDITYNDFISMAKSKEFSVVSEALKMNNILIGIEEYYRLLKKCYIKTE